MWCSKNISLKEDFRQLDVRLRRNSAENLVDSYTELVPKALEVLPSETRLRI
jgi:hypothetical protein